MKLLLTSCGLTNASLAGSLRSLVGKDFRDVAVTVIPTAANAEPGDKGWLIDDLMSLKRLNFKSIDIADISREDRQLWLPMLEKTDVLYFGGGKRYHLMEWLVRSGLSATLSELLKTKVYVGMSAGSMVTGPDLGLSISHRLFSDDLDRTDELSGLGYVNFRIIPHFNNPYFANVKEETIESAIADFKEKVYALDDASAVEVIGNEERVVSEGTWKVYG